jgi:nucleoid-associated protein YgaU
VSLAVSPAVKIFALLGVLGALVLGLGMMLMGGETDTEPTAASALLDAPTRAKKVAAKAEAAAAAKKAVATPAVAKPAPKVAKAKPKAKAQPAQPLPTRGVAANGLPREIMVSLRSHNVVVVSLWGTGGKIDAMSRDEAAAGAEAVGAGFVSFNVLDRGREAEALTLELGVVLRAPTVLLFTSGGKLANTLEGFRDRETVGQAALNALR